MSTWSDLDRELNAWQNAGRLATLWWRDDDARSATDSLDRLLSVRREARVPLAIAVIPAGAHDPLARRLAPLAEVTVLQHGYAHQNHAPENEKKSELGAHRPADQVLGELIAGREKLISLFAGKVLPVIVPPWNRFDDSLIPKLAERGFTGLSCFGARSAEAPVSDIVQVNTHVDLVDWRNRRRFIGVEAALDGIVKHLTERRAGEIDALEPTGLLTHHLVHDRGCWDFLTNLLDRTRAHAAVRWVSARELFPNVRNTV